MKSPKSTPADLGHYTSIMPDLVMVENSLDVHNAVGCTLCFCYSRDMIGPPTEWYRRAIYRARVVRDLREVLAEFGFKISAKIKLKIYYSTADL